MPLIFAQSMFSERVLRAICWTLVHSCWQGLLLAVITGLIILLTRRSLPSVRYKVLSGLLCLFFIGVACTFAWQIRSGGEGAVREGGASVLAPGSLSPGSSTETPILSGFMEAGGSQSWWDRTMQYFNGHAPLIVAIWFVIFMARLIRIFAHLGTIQRIRHYKVSHPSDHWKERVGQLARRLEIRRKVELLESALIQVPMMAGILKPVILVPLGLLAQLPPEQVEAILLHELAHIRRKDYFINLLFSFGETLFFFNPAVLWIAALIREERENCCDDIAVGQIGNKREFIDALVSFQEYSKPDLHCALAFPGSGNYLLKRVKRIVHRDDKVLDISEKFFLLFCLLVAGGLMMAFSGGEKPSDIKIPQARIIVSKRDTVPKPPARDTVVPDRLMREKIMRDTLGMQLQRDSLSPDARNEAWRVLRQQQDALTRDRKSLMEDQAKIAKLQAALALEHDELAEKYKKMEIDAMDRVEKGDGGSKKKLNAEDRKFKMQRDHSLQKKVDLEIQMKMAQDEQMQKDLSPEQRKELEEKVGKLKWEYYDKYARIVPYQELMLKKMKENEDLNYKLELNYDKKPSPEELLLLENANAEALKASEDQILILKKLQFDVDKGMYMEKKQADSSKSIKGRHF